MLAVGDVPAAHGAATELSTIAELFPMVALRAAVVGAQGAVAAARGERRSLAQLRESWRLWRETSGPAEHDVDPCEDEFQVRRGQSADALCEGITVHGHEL
jgi:hypothetical protein